jgi:hypothetical protein
LNLNEIHDVEENTLDGKARQREDGEFCEVRVLK